MVAFRDASGETAEADRPHPRGPRRKDQSHTAGSKKWTDVMRRAPCRRSRPSASTRLRRRPSRRGEIARQGARYSFLDRFHSGLRITRAGAVNLSTRHRQGESIRVSRSRTGPSWTSGSTCTSSISGVPLYSPRSGRSSSATACCSCRRRAAALRRARCRIRAVRFRTSVLRSGALASSATSAPTYRGDAGGDDVGAEAGPSITTNLIDEQKEGRKVF